MHIYLHNIPSNFIPIRIKMIALGFLKQVAPTTRITTTRTRRVAIWDQCLKCLKHLSAHIIDTLRTVIAGCFHRNVLVLVKVDASVTAAEQLAVITSHTLWTFYLILSFVTNRILQQQTDRQSLPKQQLLRHKSEWSSDTEIIDKAKISSFNGIWTFLDLVIHTNNNNTAMIHMSAFNFRHTLTALSTAHCSI